MEITVRGSGFDRDAQVRVRPFASLWGRPVLGAKRAYAKQRLQLSAKIERALFETNDATNSGGGCGCKRHPWLTEHLLRFHGRAENMIKRRRGDRSDQRVAVAVELIVPAARDRVAKVVPVKAS